MKRFMVPRTAHCPDGQWAGTFMAPAWTSYGEGGGASSL